MARISQLRLLLLAGLLAAASGGQVELNPAAPRDSSVIRVDVDLVDLLCSVQDKSGNYVRGLTKDDFEIYEDGKRRPVAHFARVEDSPLTVALLLDVSGSVRYILDIEREAARQFFARVLRKGDRGLLAGFAEHVMVWQDLTSKLEFLNSALDSAGPMNALPNQPPAHGGTLLYEAIDLVAERKLQSLPGRKAMVLITDGEDRGSRIKLDEAVNASQQADAVIYGIYYVDPNQAYGYGLHVLERLSGPTGGSTFQVGRKISLARVFAEIEEEMRNQYAVGFAPSDPTKRGVLHKVEVKVTRPEVKVRSRTGYYSK